MKRNLPRCHDYQSYSLSTTPEKLFVCCRFRLPRNELTKFLKSISFNRKRLATNNYSAAKFIVAVPHKSSCGFRFLPACITNPLNNQATWKLLFDWPTFFIQATGWLKNRGVTGFFRKLPVHSCNFCFCNIFLQYRTDSIVNVRVLDFISSNYYPSYNASMMFGENMGVKLTMWMCAKVVLTMRFKS